MSSTTKKRIVMRQMLDEFSLPEAFQSIVRVSAGRGNNLHEVETPQGDRYLVSMPNKFRRNIWIKRGDYVLVEPIEEGDKVQAEIVRILYKDHIRIIKKEGLWPKEFDAAKIIKTEESKESKNLGNGDAKEGVKDEGVVITNGNGLCNGHVHPAANQKAQCNGDIHPVVNEKGECNGHAHPMTNGKGECSDESEESDVDDDLFENTNRPAVVYNESSSSASDDDDTDATDGVD